MRFSISLVSLLISFAVFFVVRQVVFALRPTNYLFAEIVVLLISTFTISVIFALRAFRGFPGKKMREPMFHRMIMQTFLINLVILFLLFTVRRL